LLYQQRLLGLKLLNDDFYTPDSILIVQGKGIDDARNSYIASSMPYTKDAERTTCFPLALEPRIATQQ
jgi:hypothetical protein